MSKANNDLFNWYETKAMKSIMPKSAKYDYSATGIPPHSRVCIIGGTGAGKTQVLAHYIRLSPNLFSRIIIFNKEDEAIYDMLNKGLNNKIEFHHNLSELETLKDLRKDMDDGENILLVLDDFMFEIGSNKFKNLNDYFIRGRKKNISLFLLSQNFYTIPKPLRNNCNFMIFCKINSTKDVGLIMSEYDNKNKDLRQIYKKIMEKPLQFMKLQTTVCSDFEKVSLNFTDYIEFKQD